ncbi:hypothetical protein BDW42DRAFT_75175 [Aspergillus taichungensis]|uniref:Uncharacterized protein n=1 Tax=Aspergillus taichungensis TaxID=482145 RepID=A0A2J5HZ86_9EURO|nr:hypothetical protein BDW42DRAFT_75175 [Aspergillus taichungensis]
MTHVEGIIVTIHQVMCSCAFSPPHQPSPIEVQTAESVGKHQPRQLTSGQWPHHWPCPLPPGVCHKPEFGGNRMLVNAQPWTRRPLHGARLHHDWLPSPCPPSLGVSTLLVGIHNIHPDSCMEGNVGHSTRSRHVQLTAAMMTLADVTGLPASQHRSTYGEHRCLLFKLAWRGMASIR